MVGARAKGPALERDIVVSLGVVAGGKLLGEKLQFSQARNGWIAIEYGRIQSMACSSPPHCSAASAH